MRNRLNGKSSLDRLLSKHPNMKIHIAILTASIGAFTAFAADDTGTSSANPPAPTAEIKYPWQSSVSAGLTLARGNTDTTLFTADFLTQKKTPNNEYSLGASGAYGDQDSKETVNNYKAFGQWNHLFTDHFYSYVRAEAMRDIIADVDYRITVGPGVGYYLLKQTNTFLAGEAGAAYETEHLDGQSSQNFATVRLAEKFEYKFKLGPRFWENVEFLPQVDKFDNYLINAEVGVETPLTKSFSLKTFLDDSYQNRPAPGKLKNDAMLVAALAYKF